MAKFDPSTATKKKPVYLSCQYCFMKCNIVCCYDAHFLPNFVHGGDVEHVVLSKLVSAMVAIVHAR